LRQGGTDTYKKFDSSEFLCGKKKIQTATKKRAGLSEIHRQKRLTFAAHFRVVLLFVFLIVIY